MGSDEKSRSEHSERRFIRNQDASDILVENSECNEAEIRLSRHSFSDGGPPATK